MRTNKFWGAAIAMSAALSLMAAWSAIAAGETRQVAGTILSVENNGLSIMNGKESLSLVVAADTAITLDGEPAMLVDLRPGWSLTASYQEVAPSGQKKAKEIVVRSKQPGDRPQVDPSGSGQHSLDQR